MYYYRYNDEHNPMDARELTDDWMNSCSDIPKTIFEKKNDINIWWHKNDTTGKIDMNINMADSSIRKNMAT